MTRFFMGSVAAALAGMASITALSRPPQDTVTTPRATIDSTITTGGSRDTAVFAGGCFWGVEAAFEHVQGVTNVVSGYAGGDAKTATYDLVSSGTTKHAESVRIIYDPSQVSYGNLLRVFFSIAHDPTQLNRQGPDVGTQYRSVIFFLNPQQERIAKAYINQVKEAKVFKKPIVTAVSSLPAFYPAEAYHQDFAERHPDHPYIVVHDRPKVERLHKQLPEMYQELSHASK